MSLLTLRVQCASVRSNSVHITHSTEVITAADCGLSCEILWFTQQNVAE